MQSAKLRRTAPTHVPALEALRAIAKKRGVRVEAKSAPLPIRHMRRQSEEITFSLEGEGADGALEEFDNWLEAHGVF